MLLLVAIYICVVAVLPGRGTCLSVVANQDDPLAEINTPRLSLGQEVRDFRHQPQKKPCRDFA
jgi:hypothetical protein